MVSLDLCFSSWLIISIWDQHCNQQGPLFMLLNFDVLIVLNLLPLKARPTFEAALHIDQPSHARALESL